MTDYRYKWVRAEVRGVVDKLNLVKAEKAGWEPVPPDEYPTDPVPPDIDTNSLHRFRLLEYTQPGEQGGLVLHRVSEEDACKLDAKPLNLATAHRAAVEDHYMWIDLSNTNPRTVFGDDKFRMALHDLPGFVAQFPEKPSEAEREAVLQLIEDFLSARIEREGVLDHVNELRAKTQRAPLTDEQVDKLRKLSH